MVTEWQQEQSKLTRETRFHNSKSLPKLALLWWLINTISWDGIWIALVRSLFMSFPPHWACHVPTKVNIFWRWSADISHGLVAVDLTYCWGSGSERSNYHSVIHLSQIWEKTYRLAKAFFNIRNHPIKDVHICVIVEHCDRITSVTFTGPERWKQNCVQINMLQAHQRKKKENLDIDLREMRWTGYTVIYDMFTVHQQMAFSPLNLLSGSRLNQKIYQRTCFLIARLHLITQICATN